MAFAIHALKNIFPTFFKHGGQKNKPIPKKQQSNRQHFYSQNRISFKSISQQVFFKTEREGFEPSRVLPLHDFESCAINRALPPLLNVKKTSFNPKGPPARRLWPLDDAANVADPAWAENPAMFLSIDLIER